MLVVITGLLSFALPKFAYNDSVKHMVETADREGYRDAQILSMHNVSHNAEFYAAGRLFRDENGDQWRFLSAKGVADHIKENGGKEVLVLIPHHLTKQLTESGLIETKYLDKDAELTMIAVKLKKQTGNRL